MLSVRPPEYLPGLAFFALMAHADRMILADTFQYSRQSLQNRARFRTPQGWQWVSIPLRGGQHGQPICDVRIEGTLWRGKHWRAFSFNYRSTPFFEYYEDRFRALYDEPLDRLGVLTCSSIELLRDLLGIETQLIRASGLEGSPGTLEGVLGVMEGGRFLVPEEAAPHDARIVPRLKVFRFTHPIYRQNFDGFEAGMSVVDLLFNYGPEASNILRRDGCAIEEWRDGVGREASM